MKTSLATIALVGRPNVGKSTLFNALCGKRTSIVSHIPGTTRDNVTAKVESNEYAFLLVDTAGLTDKTGESLEDAVQTQARLAMEHADIILFLVDGRAEMTLEDEEALREVRKSKKPVFLLVNKIDDGNVQKSFEYYKLGIKTVITTSGKNNTGLWDLYEEIDSKLAELGFVSPEESEDAENDERAPIRVAFIGRPNVGKSSLINALIDQEKTLVSDVSGTTRDAVDVEFRGEGGVRFVFVDTAGLRRRSKQKDMEFWSAVRTVRSIEESDICIVLLDALDGATHQDLTIIGKVLEAGKGLLICVNKYDLMQEKTRQAEETDDRELIEVKMWGESLDKVRKKYLTYLAKKIPFTKWASVVFLSAKTKRGLKDIFPALEGIAVERTKRISTSELNHFLPEIVHGHVPPSYHTKMGKMKYLSQVATNPPKFIASVNNVEAFHSTYRKYVENKLREKYGFYGTPIILEFRDSMDKNPRRKK